MKRILLPTNVYTKQVPAVLAYLILILFAVGCTSSPGEEAPALDMDNNMVVQQLEQMRTGLLSASPAAYPEIAVQVEHLRESLNRLYENRESSQTWQEVEPQLETLEQQLRNESDNALTTLDQIIETLRADMEPNAG